MKTKPDYGLQLGGTLLSLGGLLGLWLATNWIIALAALVALWGNNVVMMVTLKSQVFDEHLRTLEVHKRYVEHLQRQLGIDDGWDEEEETRG